MKLEMGTDECRATLLARFVYEPETGDFFRNGRAMNSSTSFGYRRIHLGGGRWMRAHRAAWLIVHGAFTAGTVIDHINGDKADNRIANLREVSNAANNQNRVAASRSSKTGVLGVFKKRGKFAAEIGVNGRMIWLGSFGTVEDASSAYWAAKSKYHENFARSR